MSNFLQKQMSLIQDSFYIMSVNQFITKKERGAMKIIKVGDKKLIARANDGWKKGTGKNEAFWFKKVRCVDEKKFAVCERKEGCGAEMEIRSDELELLYYFGTHFRHDYAAFKCPCCGKYSSAGNVPAEVWGRVSKRIGVFDGFDDRID